MVGLKTFVGVELSGMIIYYLVNNCGLGCGTDIFNNGWSLVLGLGMYIELSGKYPYYKEF